jgi:DNA-binding NarL/FixJ family response regulator
MTTATSADARTEPIHVESGALDTGPQAVLELAEQGLPQRTIAQRLHISQATVTRRIREAVEARQAQRRAYAVAAMCTVLTLCAVVMTIAVSCLAWAESP